MHFGCERESEKIVRRPLIIVQVKDHGRERMYLRSSLSVELMGLNMKYEGEGK